MHPSPVARKFDFELDYEFDSNSNSNFEFDLAFVSSVGDLDLNHRQPLQLKPQPRLKQTSSPD
jgi:hypothetical protein